MIAFKFTKYTLADLDLNIYQPFLDAEKKLKLILCDKSLQINQTGNVILKASV